MTTKDGPDRRRAAPRGGLADDDTLFVTARHRVRRLRDGDAAALHRIYGDADAMRHVGDGRPPTAELCAEWVRVTQANVERRGYGMCAVTPIDSEDVIGCCGLVHPGGQDDAELKYAWRRDAWGGGRAGEVASAMVSHALRTLALPRVVATVAPAHEVSRRVLESAGLRHRADRRNGDGSVTAVYRLARDELRLRRAVPDEAAALGRLALAAKAHWGYTQADLERWREELIFEPQAIARGGVWLAEWCDGRGAEPQVGPPGVAGVVGVVACGGSGPRRVLDHLWVAPQAIGRGVGRALLDWAAARARREGAQVIEIDADPHAEPFYLRCGATRIGQTAAPVEGQPDRVRPLLELALGAG